MSELLILDPEAVAEDRVEFDITKYIAEAGPDFGDAEIEAYLAQAERGQLPVGFRIPNRHIQVPLMLTDRDEGLSFDDIRRRVQAKTALFQQEGGWLRRDTQVGAVYADVVSASLKLGAGLFAAQGLVDPDAVLTIECLPDWYADEIVLDAIVRSAGVAFPEIADVLQQDGRTAIIAGDYPGRVRIVVEDDSGADQRSLVWGFRCLHYDDAATARLSYEAEDLTPLDTAVAAIAGGAWLASVKHSSVATTWTPVLSTQLAAGGDLTHVGSYRVLARVRGDAQVRLVYDVGDLTLPSENAPWTPPSNADAFAFYIADLGRVRLDPAPVGTHCWRGHIQAKGPRGGETCEIDRLWLQPVDESAGQVTAPLVADTGLTAYTIRDDFSIGTADLDARDVPVGPGSWAGFGDADDWACNAEAARRSAVSDAVAETFTPLFIRNPLGFYVPFPVDYPAGRFGIAGSQAFSDVAAQVDVAYSDDVEIFQGVVVRWTDIDNYLLAAISAHGGYAIAVKAVDGDLAMELAALPFSATTGTLGTAASGNAYTVRVQADSDGHWAVWAAPQGAIVGTPILAGYDSDLAAGGALATGKAGIFDGQTASTANTRGYDNFAAWVPVSDAVVYGHGTAELRTDGIYRESESGYGYGRLTPIGALPRIPPSGLEQRPVELLLRMTRGDFDQLPDTELDDLTVQVHYRPSWLFLPEV